LRSGHSRQCRALQGVCQALTGNAKDKDLAEARKSAEYRDAHDAASEQIGNLPKEESDKACAEGLQSAAN